MKTREKIIKDVLKGMEGISGVPSNKKFYDEFDMRLRAALGISQPEQDISDLEKHLCVGCHLWKSEYIEDSVIYDKEHSDKLQEQKPTDEEIIENPKRIPFECPFCGSTNMDTAGRYCYKCKTSK